MEQPPLTGDGQVHMGTSFGKALWNLAKQSDVKKVLEIGTWFGGGSTLCLAKGLKESDPEMKEKVLYTIEIYEPAWDYARKRYKKEYPNIRFILGGTVPISGYLSKEEVIAAGGNDLHYDLYYDRDLKLANYFEPMLEPLCKNHKFDLVLIDGNEYSGWAEFLVVNDYCKPKYLALHDVGTLKTSKISKFIKDNPMKFKLLSRGSDGSHWEIYQFL